MEENIVYPVNVTLISSIDGEETKNNYLGEYRLKNGIHMVAYTDHSEIR